MNSFWRFLSLGGALVVVVVAAIWVAIVYLFPAPRSSPATKASEPMSFNVQGAVTQPAPIVAAPTVPSQTSIAQKTVEACQEEWRAIRAAGQRTTTEKAYVAECQTGGATAQTSPSPTTTALLPSEGGAQKTVEACQEEWRAMRTAGQRTTTEKAYVAQCRTAAPDTSPAVTALPASPSGPPMNSPAPAASTAGGGSPAPTGTGPSRKIRQQ